MSLHNKIIYRSTKRITFIPTFLQEAGIKNQKLELEKLGLNINDKQQNVMKQQNLIDNYHETIANIAKIRQEIEAEVETCKNTYKSEQEKLNNAQKEGYISYYDFSIKTHTIPCVATKCIIHN
jgi:uncharacterized protein (DUF3084 family)